VTSRNSEYPEREGSLSNLETANLETSTNAILQEIAANTIWQDVKMLSLEQQVLTTLSQIKQTLFELKHHLEPAAHQQISQRYDSQLQQLAIEHKQRKQQRGRDRTQYRQQLQGNALTAALAALTKASQQDSTERRRLKQQKEHAIAPFVCAIADTTQHIHTLKHCYAALSQSWQAHMQLAYRIPERAAPLSILYQDQHLIVIDKPAGLLSVPGRRYHLQDSVVSRLRHQLPQQTFLQPVHRLDQATSGVLAIALTPAAHRSLSQQFAQHQVHKTYEAVLSRPITLNIGTIDLPLCPDIKNRPKQSVNFHSGKPSRTEFKVLLFGASPRVEFVPLTGRTHQLRVHAAHLEGLNSPIVGDSLYNSEQTDKRLRLHATSLQFLHPITRENQRFISTAPF